jgi:hypothetical protein
MDAKYCNALPNLALLFDNPKATTNSTWRAIAKTSLRSTDMATFNPKSCSGNLGYGLRYKLGYRGSTAAEKYKSYQYAG